MIKKIQVRDPPMMAGISKLGRFFLMGKMISVRLFRVKLAKKIQTITIICFSGEAKKIALSARHKTNTTALAVLLNIFLLFGLYPVGEGKN